jgi:hypothetical protein
MPPADGNSGGGWGGVAQGAGLLEKCPGEAGCPPAPRSLGTVMTWVTGNKGHCERALLDLLLEAEVGRADNAGVGLRLVHAQVVLLLLDQAQQRLTSGSSGRDPSRKKVILGLGEGPNHGCSQPGESPFCGQEGVGEHVVVEPGHVAANSRLRSPAMWTRATSSCRRRFPGDQRRMAKTATPRRT